MSSIVIKAVYPADYLVVCAYLMCMYI